MVNSQVASTQAIPRDENRMGLGFPGGTVVKNLPANAVDTGSTPSPGRSHMPRSN